MTTLSVISFVLAALLIAMGCVKADRIRSWRTALNPSAPEISDAAFVAARVLLLATAAACLWAGVQGLAAEDDSKWSDDELTSAVQGAVTAVDGTSKLGDIHGGEAHVDEDNARMIENEVIEHGAGDAPQLGVDAASSPGNTPSHASYTVTANGADIAFCVAVNRTRTKEDDYHPPGIAGGTGTVTIPSYSYRVTSRTGAC
ncbi:hypothetical protein GCM10022384_46150 [Streptomyces marokkonensis]|uniref:Secreted protein n=1 Tax=Streptomyces marokkonensis TaxID=324855 RepID=A0ABP7R6J2_9ACTN